MLTPKLLDGLLLAHHASGRTLHRCRGGFHDDAMRFDADAQKVTVRTANALVEMGLAIYDHPIVHSRLSLTPDGIAEAARLLEKAA